MTKRSQPNYFPALTGVRALAAYLVFISHFYNAFDEVIPQFVQHFFRELHIGVTVFFVLSGFLITYRYYNNFHLTADWFKQYLKNRVARIYPMYFLLTTAVFVFYYFSHDMSITKNSSNPWVVYGLNVFFFRGFFYQYWDSGIAQGWSLTVEECFYFSAPFIFYIAIKYKRFYVQPLCLTALGFIMVFMFRNLDWHGFFGNFTFMMLFTFLGRCFEFFVGIQLALLLLKKGFVRTNKVKYTYIGFVLMFVFVGIMSTLQVPAPWVASLENPVGIILNNYFIASAIALFFYGLLTEQTVMKKVLATPFVELLGKASYIFYLIHLGYISNYLHNLWETLNDMVLNLYDKWGLEWQTPFAFDWLNMVYAFIILNVLSVILFKFIEEPLNHYIRKSNFLIKPKPSA